MANHSGNELPCQLLQPPQHGDVFGAGANSSQAHGPFATPRHEQIETHSPFPAPYMEQISVKEIIQPEGVIQIIPNRHDGGMLC